jgi:hypothetical protein
VVSACRWSPLVAQQLQHGQDSAVFTPAAWLGWAQESPPRRWRAPLVAGWLLACAAVIASVWRTWAAWQLPSALDSTAAHVWFGVVVAAEVLLSAFGAIALARAGHGRWTSSWVCLVVGAHFIPLAVLFRAPALHLLGAVLVVVAVGSSLGARRVQVHPSAITGAAAGIVFLLFAVGAWSASVGAA